MNLIHIYNYYSSIWKCSIFRTLGFFTLSLDILEACPLRVIRVKQTTIGRVRPWIGDLEWNYWVILNKVKTTPPCFYSNLSHRLTHWQFSQITDPQLYENLRSFLSLPIFMSQFRFYFCWSSTSWGPCPFQDKCHLLLCGFVFDLYVWNTFY